MGSFTDVVDKVRSEQDIDEAQLFTLLSGDEDERDYLHRAAREVCDGVYGHAIYLRGLIEFSNYCQNDCNYCGIRRSNRVIERYRLSPDEIISCADTGYLLGFRTVVLQSGEDLSYSDDDICYIIKNIKRMHPNIAVTLSLGEKEEESFKAYFEAGADRYLLRHETADKAHYEYLHPSEMSFLHRMNCLRQLKQIGYQVGCGFMVGSPKQDIRCLYEDLRFIKEFEPHMVGIGPFLPQSETPYADEESGTAQMTIDLISILRLISPKLLLPATTALGTADAKGREKGILAGANVVMPNLSPVDVRNKYLLYDNKICTGEEAAECINCLSGRIRYIGYEVEQVRGDHPDYTSEKSA